jgi:hypothetical protein
MSASTVLAFFVAVPAAAPATVKILLPMEVALKEDFTGMGGRRDASQERSARKKMMTAAEWGKQLLPLRHFLLSHHWKLLVHPSRTLRRGSGGMDLAIHVSAPRVPQPPLRTVIEETWWTFFTQRAGRAVIYGQQPERAAAGRT